MNCVSVHLLPNLPQQVYEDADEVGWNGVKPDRMGQLEAEWAGR